MTVTTMSDERNEHQIRHPGVHNTLGDDNATELVPQKVHSTRNDERKPSAEQTITGDYDDYIWKEGASQISTQHDVEASFNEQIPTRNDSKSRSGESAGASGGSFSAGPPQSFEHQGSVMLTVAICLVAFLSALDRTVIATAVPQITDDFHSLNDIGWYASAFMFANACLLLPFGKLYTFYPPRWVYLISIAIFEVGSLVCASAQSSAVFILGRAIAGAGSAGCSVGNYTLLFCVVPLHQRPWYTGLLGGVIGISAVTGPLLGGAFATYASWRWCFLINLPIGGVAMLVVLLCLRPLQAVQAGLCVRQQLAQLDVLGEFLLIPSITCLILALHWGGAQHSWSDGRVLAVLATFAATLVAFGIVQILLPETATIPARVAKNRSMVAGMVFETCLSATLMVSLWCIPVWFQNIKNTTAMRSGVNTIPILVAFCIGAVLSGALVHRIGYYTPVAMASSAIASTGAGLILTWNTATSTRESCGYQIVLGLGIGLGFQQGGTVAQTVLMADDVPTGLALMNVIQLLSGAVFVSVGQNLFKAHLIQKLGAVLHNEINPLDIINTGATELRQLIPQQDLPRALEAYNSALRQAFLLGFIMACASALGSCLLEWKSVRKEHRLAKGANRRT